MWRILGEPGRDLCDRGLGVSRRDVLRVGGSGMLGLTLGGSLQLQAEAAKAGAGGGGWGKARALSCATCREARRTSTCGIRKPTSRTT